MNVSDVLTRVAQKSDSMFVLLAIIIAMVAIVIAIPILKIMAKRDIEKAKKDLEKLDKYTQREGQIIHVVQQNTEAFTKLVTMLEVNNRNCDNCKTEQTGLWIKANDKLNSILTIVDRRRVPREEEENAI
jgi:hypothetical protein